MELNILIIDDSPDDIFFFTRALKDSGISAKMMSNMDGKSGLNSIRENRFDCIFLDYVLPGMDGLEVLTTIRSQHIDTPVIMLTGQHDEQMIVKLMQQGATDYLPKHALNPESLRICIENSQKLYLMQVEKQKAEESLRISEARLAEAQNIGRIGNWEHDFVNNTHFLSEEAQKIIEDHSLFPFKNFSKKIYHEDFEILRETMRNLKNGYPIEINIRFHASFNRIKYLNVKGCVVLENHHNMEIKKIVGTIQDITELKNAILDTKKATAKNKA